MSHYPRSMLLMTPAKQNGTRLEGWDFIQEKVHSHDEDMIAGYTDDIDTLLVFVSIATTDDSRDETNVYDMNRLAFSPPC